MELSHLLLCVLKGSEQKWRLLTPQQWKGGLRIDGSKLTSWLELTDHLGARYQGKLSALKNFFQQAPEKDCMLRAAIGASKMARIQLHKNAIQRISQRRF